MTPPPSLQAVHVRRASSSGENHGLHRLYPEVELDGVPRRVDIIAIHGLNGHPFDTWTSPDGHLWLRDSLPSELQFARIMTYGYDSKLFFSKSQSNLADFARDFLWRLRCERLDSAAEERPIFFVCHSMGGLLIKQALITASTDKKWYGSILSSTKGLVFMGTPHRGSRSAELASPLARIIEVSVRLPAIRSDLLKVLKLSSPVLDDLNERSKALLQDLPIISFYEQKQIASRLIVEPFSAKLGLPNELCIPINATHTEMVRFSPTIQEQKYRPVRLAIAQMIESYLQDHSEQFHEVLDLLLPLDYNQSLVNIPNHHEKTCIWIEREEEFRDWASSTSSGSLLILGPPGVGKSVLTKSLITKISLGQLDGTFRSKKVAFFMCSQDHPGSNTADAIFRALLHQILSSDLDIFDLIKSKIPMSRDPVERRLRISRDGLLSPTNLKFMLETVLALSRCQFTSVVVDGVDEMAPESAAELLSTLTSIQAVLNERFPDQGIKFLLSARYLPSKIQIDHTNLTIIDLSDHHSSIKTDISTFVTGRINTYKTDHSTFAQAIDEPAASSVINVITDKADCMFLWAELALNAFLKKQLWSRRRLHQRLPSLQGLPSGISSLYQRFFEDLDSDVLSEGWEIFALVASLDRPANFAEIGIMLSLIEMEDEAPTSVEEIDSLVGVEALIKGNFANVLRTGDDGCLRFVHLSFKDFLVANDFADRNTGERLVDLARMNRNIANACLDYLDLPEIVQMMSRPGASYAAIEQAYALFDYANQHALAHLLYLPDEDDTWLKFAVLHKGILAEVEFINEFRRGLKLAMPMGILAESPLIYVIKRKSRLLVGKFLKTGYFDVDAELPNSMGWKPEGCSYLHYCCSVGADEMIPLLVNAGADPNRQDCHGSTPLHVAVVSKSLPAIRVLLQVSSIDPNIRDVTMSSAVHEAVGSSEEILAEMLASSGVDVNATNSQGQTAFHLAVLRHHGSAIWLLSQCPRVRMDIVDKTGALAIDLASRSIHIADLSILINNTIRIPTPPPDSRIPSLVCRAAIWQDADLFMEALSKASDLDKHRDFGRKGLVHLCVVNGWSDGLREAARRGINIDQIDKFGRTGLHYAATEENTDMVEALLRLGASSTVQDSEGKTAAMVAVESGFGRGVRLLIEAADCDLSLRDNKQRSLLLWATAYDWVAIIKKIVARLEREALLSRDARGYNAVDITYIYRCSITRKYLLGLDAFKGYGMHPALCATLPAEKAAASSSESITEWRLAMKRTFASALISFLKGEFGLAAAKLEKALEEASGFHEDATEGDNWVTLLLMSMLLLRLKSGELDETDRILPSLARSALGSLSTEIASWVTEEFVSLASIAIMAFMSAGALDFDLSTRLFNRIREELVALDEDARARGEEFMLIFVFRLAEQIFVEGKKAPGSRQTGPHNFMTDVSLDALELPTHLTQTIEECQSHSTSDIAPFLVAQLAKLALMLELHPPFPILRSHVLDFLGRSLLWLGDEKHAIMVLQYSAELAATPWPPQWQPQCDGCRKPILEEVSERFLCAQCFTIDLCARCMVLYGRDAICVEDCLDHHFVLIPPPPVEPAEAQDVIDATRRSWLRDLIEVYEGRLRIELAYEIDV